jgi:hypothetical protein
MAAKNEFSKLYDAMRKTKFRPGSVDLHAVTGTPKSQSSTKKLSTELLQKFHPNKARKYPDLDVAKMKQVAEVLIKIRKENPKRPRPSGRPETSAAKTQKRTYELIDVAPGVLRDENIFENGSFHTKFNNMNYRCDGTSAESIAAAHNRKRDVILVDLGFQYGTGKGKEFNLNSINIPRASIRTTKDLFDLIARSRGRINNETEKLSADGYVTDVHKGFYVMIKNFIFPERLMVPRYKYKPNVYIHTPSNQPIADLIEPWASILVVVKQPHNKTNQFWKPI